MSEVENIAAHKYQYKCALCPYSAKFLSHYKRHVKTHSDGTPFKCPECSYRAKRKGNVNVHLKNVHVTSTKFRSFKCPHPGCSYAAKLKSNLTQPSKLHCDEKSFSCSQHNFSFSTNIKSDFTRHTRTHTGEKPFVCQFESCSYAATTRSQLVVHTRIHTKEKPYKCPQPNCNYTANQKTNLNRHSLDHEPKAGEKHVLFSCPIESCEYSTKHKADVSSHVKSHSLEKSFACPVESCDYSCKFNANLFTHLKTHSEERRYKCELCPFRGKTRNTVINHLKRVHSDPNFRPFKCKEPQCDYRFKRKGDLQKHLLTHKQEKKYPCTFRGCDYRAILKSYVKSHEKNIHTDEKKEKCGICEFTCKTKFALTVHIRTHTKEEPYKCKGQGCEYRAKNSGGLRKHEQKNHPQLVTKGN